MGIFGRTLLLVLVATLVSGSIAAQQSNRGFEVGTQQIPGAARVVSGQPSSLSLAQAIDLAIANNLATLLAHERREEARGEKQQSLAPLLPNVSAVAYQANLTENLAALGLQAGTIPGGSRDGDDS